MSPKALLATCGVVALAACATARPTPPPSLPVPLVTALLNDRGVTRPAPAYAVGALPPKYPGDLVPTAPATIVGGMTNGDEVIAVFADSTRRLSAVLEQVFEHAGFTRPPPAAGAGFTQRSGPYTYFCRDSATVMAEPMTGPSRSLVRVTYRVIRGRFPCAATTTGPPPDSLALHLPELSPPPGIRATGTHGSYSGSGMSSGADLVGIAMVPAAILSHYASQLVAAGWTGAAPAISEHLAAQVFEAKAPSGATWEGILMFYGSDTAMTASLAMHPRGKPQGGQ